MQADIQQCQEEKVQEKDQDQNQAQEGILFKKPFKRKTFKYKNFTKKIYSCPAALNKLFHINEISPIVSEFLQTLGKQECQYWRKCQHTFKGWVREACNDFMILTDLKIELKCTLTPSCLNYIQQTYPSCFHAAPKSLEHLLICIIDYTLIPHISGPYHTSIAKFELELSVNHLKIIYCDRLSMKDIETNDDSTSHFKNRRMAACDNTVRVRGHHTQIVQNQSLIPLVRYFLHHQAKVNVYQDFKFEQKLPDIGLIVERKPEKQEEMIQMRNTQDILCAQVESINDRYLEGDLQSIAQSELENAYSPLTQEELAPQVTSIDQQVMQSKLNTQTLLSQFEESEILRMCENLLDDSDFKYDAADVEMEDLSEPKPSIEQHTLTFADFQGQTQMRENTFAEYQGNTQVVLNPETIINSTQQQYYPEQSQSNLFNSQEQLIARVNRDCLRSRVHEMLFKKKWKRLTVQEQFFFGKTKFIQNQRNLGVNLLQLSDYNQKQSQAFENDLLDLKRDTLKRICIT
ncbi:hypothetical protein FGO68_gene14985 [Halteria grandinella]|uniref:Uncharacterized protein n=1 Tax=Halteria grandinella TaxID=5974 RepID=A0A8J8T276_HALGN|nr:hypothetical protein FGO68_gene14985 [Halteria grandinella]